MKKMVLNLVGKFRKALPFLVMAISVCGLVSCNEDDISGAEIPDEKDNKYIVQIAVPEDNYNYKHNTRGLVGTVDWGDGITEDFVCGDTVMVSHTYEKKGEYIVTCTGIVSKLDSNDKWGVSRIINKLIHIGKDCKVIGMASAFQGHELITEIPEGFFDGCDKVDFWSFAFKDCTGITEIPEGLFDKCTGATKLGNCFNGCVSLKKLPARLLPENNKVIDLKSLFYGCVSLTEIPATLFDNCTEVIECSNTFGRCIGLTSIPEGLFDVCVKVEDFEGLFDDCEALTNIPVGLFDNCTKVTNFKKTFNRCTALTGESPYTTINVGGTDVKVHLYERSSYPEHFTAPKYYGKTYYKCTGLTDYANIPSGWK